MVKPTSEQQEAVRLFLTKEPLKISAFAGSGKTTTLQLLAQASPRKGVYLAFNKAIADEAKGKFPKSVDCRTTHSMAYRALSSRFGSSSKMTQRFNAKQLSQASGYQDRLFARSLRLDAVHQADLVLRTVRRFCQSSDESIGIEHVPLHGRLLGARATTVTEVNDWAVSQAHDLWSQMTDARDRTPLGHDGYLKLWALERPRLAADFILLDEAQDTNPVVLGVLAAQSAQIVYVGDRHQQIYEWRGAVNAMEKIGNCREAHLTQSFRFGDTIAAAASRVLTTLGEDRVIQGNSAIRSSIGDTGTTEAILARTNASVILEVLEAISAGRKPYVMGGTAELQRLLSDVFELKAGKPATSPEFFGFGDWSEVVAFSETEEGESLRTFVQLVEQHGERKLWAAIKGVVADERDATVTLSTGHKAKGREWDSVRLASDFAGSASEDRPGISEAEVRLFYVAMTRAKRKLVVEPEALELFTTGAWKHSAERPTVTRTAQPPKPSPQKTTPRTTHAPVRADPRPPKKGPQAPRKSPEPPVVTKTNPWRPPPKPAPPAPAQPVSLWTRVSRMFRGNS